MSDRTMRETIRQKTEERRREEENGERRVTCNKTLVINTTVV